MAYFICEKQGRCCPHEFYDSIDQAITDSDDGVPCDHLIEVAPVVHGHFVHDGTRFSGGVDWWHCSSCGIPASGVETRFCYCPFCGAKMDGGDDGETD